MKSNTSNPRTTLLYLIALGLGAFFPASADQVTDASGNTIEGVSQVPSPDTATLKPFIIPSIDGHLRMGYLGDNLNIDRPELGSRAERRQRWQTRFDGYKTYQSLLVLGENQDILTQDNLRTLYDRVKPTPRVNGRKKGWDNVLLDAARAALSDAAAKEVFCVKERPCRYDFPHNRPVNNPAVRTEPMWGDHYNEFRFRAAYNKFVNDYAQDLVAWGAALPRQAVIVGSVALPAYDFDKNAYVINMDFGYRTKLTDGRPLSYQGERYHMTFNARSDSGEVSNIAVRWALPRAEAQALRERLQRRKSNTLYIQARGHIRFDTIDKTATHNPYALEKKSYFEYSGDRIDLYADDGMTEHIVTFETKM